MRRSNSREHERSHACLTTYRIGDVCTGRAYPTLQPNDAADAAVQPAVGDIRCQQAHERRHGRAAVRSGLEGALAPFAEEARLHPQHHRPVLALVDPRRFPYRRPPRIGFVLAEDDRPANRRR